MAIYDITLPFSSALPIWPGDPAITIDSEVSIAQGGEYNLHRLQFGTHSGTHMDAPFHFISDGITVDQIDPQLLIGDAWVCSIPDEATMVTADLLEASAIPEGTNRLLLRTSNSSLWDRGPWHFVEDFVALDAGAAVWVVDRGIRLVGIDYLSIDSFHDEAQPAHHTLLSAGIVVVEGLNLRAVAGGRYRFCCLPLKLVGCDGSPVRAILEEAPRGA